jgi:hypothetical protein
MQFPVSRYGLNFRLVVEDDAEFIVGLRTNKKLSRYISSTDSSVQNQVNWIRNYKHREAEGKEYYILFEDGNKEKLGLVRLYKIEGKSFTAGSWLVSPDADEMVGIKSDLFLLVFSFEELKLEECFIDMRKENKKLVRYHSKFFKQYKEDADNLYMVMDIPAYEIKREYLTKILHS